MSARWVAVADRKHDVGDGGADRRARERDADEVRGDQDERADEPAERPRAMSISVVSLTPNTELASQRAEDEAEDREHGPEQAIAEEAGDDAAGEQHGCGRQLIRRGEHCDRDL